MTAGKCRSCLYDMYSSKIHFSTNPEGAWISTWTAKVLTTHSLSPRNVTLSSPLSSLLAQEQDFFGWNSLAKLSEIQIASAERSRKFWWKKLGGKPWQTLFGPLYLCWFWEMYVKHKDGTSRGIGEKGSEHSAILRPSFSTALCWHK